MRATGSAPATVSSPSGLRARRAGRDRRQQSGSAQARPHRVPDADGLAARRLPRAASGERGRDGVEGLRDELAALLPDGPAYFPPDQRTDLSVEEQLAELVREKAIQLTRDEVRTRSRPRWRRSRARSFVSRSTSRRTRRSRFSSAREARWCARSGRVRGRRSRRCSASRCSWSSSSRCGRSGAGRRMLERLGL